VVLLGLPAGETVVRDAGDILVPLYANIVVFVQSLAF
jgi:hypothetical protein